ncbi:sugar porter family MFS transporter [Streptomyces sp. PKU-EA00015]|uniref:sugar porter family MFS transporter n=1 Tax=Streptomyces sp. PKU-EA00015 TaxID=2748326 RepID=UPI0015A1A11B|nr:sugar porter family MFS transporter [Streptomyces sp. PKU-EA00015]NWF27422.1 sugar porter family MFS transporter [Streptomyces sp. PKU-EA00015]
MKPTRSPAATRTLTVCVASVGGLLFGYGTGVIAGALPLVTAEYGLSPWAQGAAVSAALLGAALTAPSSGRLADRFGRLPVIGSAAAVYAVGTLASAAATGTGSLLAGRFLVGLSLGATSFAVPLYISEIAPPARRGALVTLNQLMITVGLLLSYVVAYALEPSGAWRWMLAVGIAPALLLLGGMFLVPESPDWLHSRGHGSRAALAAARLGIGTGSSPTAEGPVRGTGLRVACARAGRRWVALGLAIAVLVHLTGLNTAIYYAPTILASSGLTSAGGIVGSILVGLCNVAATVITVLALDRWGRRPLMIGGLVVMALTALGIAFAGLLGHEGTVTALLLCVFITAGAVGPAAVFWVYISEIYPSEARGALMSVATAAHWAADFVVATTFLPLVQQLSLAGTFALYAAVTGASALALARWMPETRGRPLVASGRPAAAVHHAD